jgi:DNA-binding transcriptional LysR family regulator
MLKNMQLFVEVAKAKSFRRAADVLGMPNSTVSRRISELERSVGLRLLNRTTRQVDLTDVGRAYFESCERIIHDAQTAHQALINLHAKPSGLIRVSMPVDFSIVFLSPLLADFSLLYPGIRFELDLTPASADVVGDAVDVSIRMREPKEQNVIAKHLATLKTELYASPTYLQSMGTPRSPQDLLNHACLRMRDGPWVLHRKDGSGEEVVAVTGQFIANNAGYLRTMALRGQGIVMTAQKMVQPDLDAQALVRVLPDWTLRDVSIYALTGTRLLPSKVRMLVDYLAKHLPIAIAG